ncbi:MAG: MBL fold metallo-hydrolase [Clostridia bacterium]|nr:MBL fold metallo-hydrolase [Clostridia bacterium]
MIEFASLFSGSSGNALYIEHKDTRILIDAGVSGIRIENALLSIGKRAADLTAVLVTHEHSDHTSCLGVMTRRYNLPIYINRGTWNHVKNFIGKVNEANIYHFNSNEEFTLGDFKVNPFSIPHDASDPVGFSFFAENKKITTATDIGHMNDDIRKNIENSDLLLLECNHDLRMLENGSYPYPLKRRIKGDFGHLCNDHTSQTILELARKGQRRFLLGHLSHENNYPELAFKTVAGCLIDNGFEVGKDIELEVVLRDQTSQLYFI